MTTNDDNAGAGITQAQRLAESMSNAHYKWKERWDYEKGLPGKEPQRLMEYTVTLHCTYDEFQSVLLALKGFCPGRKWYYQNEMGGRCANGTD